MLNIFWADMRSFELLTVTTRACQEQWLQGSNMRVGAEIATGFPETTLWENRKCLLMCGIVAVANMQYGLDSACLASLQAMPGFLRVFGYPDPNLTGGYGIDVGISTPLSPAHVAPVIRLRSNVMCGAEPDRC